MQEALRIVEGKTVALVGNAMSMLENKCADEIDAHEVVIRLNMGLPHILPLSLIGGKTTIWSTARHFGPSVNPHCDLMVFMKLTKSGDRDWARFLKDNDRDYPMIRWPQELADECVEFCQCDPGTGLRWLWWLKKKASPASVDIYGMDCWETPSSWSKKFNTPNHNPSAERAAIERLCTQ